MIDFNDVPNDSNKEFDLIPAGTVARAILTMKRGGEVITDYSTQPMFKVGASGAKYLECEFTIVGGKYDKRKFWQNINQFDKVVLSTYFDVLLSEFHEMY